VKDLKDIHQGGTYVKDPKSGQIKLEKAKNPSPDTGKEKK